MSFYSPTPSEPSASIAPAASASPVVLSGRAAERLRRGGVHVARLEVIVPPQQGCQGRSDTVQLCDERGRSLGSALWSETGPIAARLFDRGGRPLTRQLLTDRIDAANRRRAALFAGQGRDAYRVVHGESDLLPGLFVDRYADAAVIQTGTSAMDARKELIADVLVETLGVTRVLFRDDGSGRDLEGLLRNRGLLRGGGAAGAPAQTRVRFHDAGSLMEADLLLDRKTGSFLDQQENHAAVADYAGRLFGGRAATALDCFTYHGGFALALCRAGLAVTACDEDADAIGQAQKNAALNRVSIDFRVANAFDLLRTLESSGARFDVVVLDPPGLAKRGRTRSQGAPGAKSADAAAERAYKELNLRGLRLLRPGGLLATCSCSGRVSAADFGELIEAAGRDVGRPLQLIERRGAGRDHPVLLGWPESEYLKCWLLRALD